MAQYTTTTPAFRLIDAPDSGDALPISDPSASGNRPLAVFLQAETHDIRFTTDGSAPTASVGMLLVAGAAPFYYAGPLEGIRFIQAESGSILNVTYVPDHTVYGVNANLTAAAVTIALGYTPANVAGATFTGALAGTDLTLSGDLEADNATLTGDLAAATYAVGATPGIDAAVTTADLVGKTLTITNGIVTGYA